MARTAAQAQVVATTTLTNAAKRIPLSEVMQIVACAEHLDVSVKKVMFIVDVQVFFSFFFLFLLSYHHKRMRKLHTLQRAHICTSCYSP